MERIAELLPNATTRHVVRKHAILLYQGEVPRQAFIISKGSFRVYRIGNSGDEQVAGFKLAGDLFPECWVYGKTTCTMYYYEALEDSEVLTIEREVLLDLLEKQPQLRRDLFDRMVENYTGLMLQVAALEQTHASDKLLLMLYYLVFRFGKEIRPGEYRINLHLTHSLLAGLTGVSRETISKELGRLKRKEIVRYDQKELIVYKDTLRKKIGDDSFSDIH
ncbi:MAG: Crp/Fnr family transcriptional regulator [Candidatus Saccharimonadaceae bacterium]